MDYVLGLILTILLLFILFNYAKISISDSSSGMMNECKNNSNSNDYDESNWGQGKNKPWGHNNVISGPVTTYPNGTPNGYDYHNFLFVA